MGWSNINSLAVKPLTQEGKISALIPLVLGLLLYTRFFSGEIKWLRRIPTALMVGVGSGLAFTRFAQSDLVGQIRGTMLPLNDINNIIIVLGALCTIAYFFFTSENKAVVGMSR